MAATTQAPMPADTLITIKISISDSLKKIKLPLRDLSAAVLPFKLRTLLEVTPDQTVLFERFSDSAGTYIALDSGNTQGYRTLVRAAKAKGKLRIKATVTELPKEEKAKPDNVHQTEPIIVSSPQQPATTPRESAAMDGRSIGSGIFQFREARASQQTLVDTSEAPVPQPFKADNKDFFEGLAQQGVKRELAFRSRESAPSPAVTTTTHPWSVYCNACDESMADAHFHCNICDGGDYDLCERCVASGTLCPGEGHWLIKRFIQDDKVVSSTTERISPRQAKPAEVEPEREVPGAFTEETKTLAEPQTPTRTCNSCVVVLPEREFVTCTSCADYDLCIKCHVGDKHGHHPAHGFKPATDDTVLPLTAELLLAPGRNTRHSAICDGCDKKILGVRYKCLNCPDWDYCVECHKNAHHIHPRHRFAPLYEPIPEPRGVTVRHYGIYCDGPLCNSKANQKYIEGVRYKCAVCHDTDFCASCEALPGNQHNRTHPLIKFKTPVNNVSITTQNDDLHGQTRIMGDRRPASATQTASTETVPVPQTNAATQVQTVAEIKPEEPKTTQPIPIVKPEEPKSVSPTKTEPIATSLLNAHFVQDTVSDGSVIQPGARFTQLWTLKNPGPYAWPAGCSVRSVGGDNMLNVDNARPAAVSDIANASESNVVGRDVQVGEEVAFKVTLKAPFREGKHISYWRMKAADGTPFGHRLWCDIVVKKAEEVKVEPKAAPAVQQFAPSQQDFTFGQSRQGQPPHIQAMQALQLQQQAHRQRQLQNQASQQRQLQFQNQGSQQRARQMAFMAQPRQALPVGTAAQAAPPSYDASANAANISARITSMREHQAKRREHMMQQFTAQVEKNHVAPKAPAASHYQAPATVTQATTGDEESEKARKEAARIRVEHIKAKILRAREEKAKAVELDRAKAVEAVEAAKEASNKPEPAHQVAIEEPQSVKEPEVAWKDAVQVLQEDEEEKEDVEDSQMVFPKLEKESPTSSTYHDTSSKAAYVENEDGEVERYATPLASSPTPLAPSPVSDDEFELDDDIEVLSASGEVDDGFTTDDEYDFLGASDTETVASK